MTDFVEADFVQYVQDLLQQHKGQRIRCFDYANQRYWLKQPEQVKGVWRFLKPQPKRAFANELAALQDLMAQNAPVPKVVLAGEDFFVLQDAGKTLSQWAEEESVTAQQKLAILADGAKALADLHRQNLVHGRPALRDMTWEQGRVRFIDFEARSKTTNLMWKKVRDSLVFIHSLGRSDVIDQEEMRFVVDKYQQYCDPEVWQHTLSFIQKNRWLYYLLLPFKPVARMDLIAIYRLFDVMLAKT